MIDQAVVLAAGRGTRLGVLTDLTPKPLLEVGCAPLVDRVLCGIRSAGVSKAVVVVGYLAERVIAHLADFEGLDIEFVHQDEPLGTGHAIGLAEQRLSLAPFVFAWADIIVEPATYGRVVAGAWGADGVLGVNRVAEPSAGAAVTLDEAGWVTSIVEKPKPGVSQTNWNNAGIGVLGPEIWAHIAQLSQSERGELELTGALEGLLAGGQKLRAVPVVEPWFDIGTPANLQAAQRAYG